MPTVTEPPRVTDEHLVVPAAVTEPVVVTFAGQYVWSFLPTRDGKRTSAGWRVEWPHAIRASLSGTTRVCLVAAVSEQVHFDDDVTFGGVTEPLSFRDRHGHPLAVDKAGHLTRVFSETHGDVRHEVVAGTARAIADLRDKVGIDAHVSYGCLLGAVREGRMIGHDSDSDLAYLSRHTEPADIIRESFRIEREMRGLGWKVVRMSGADLKLFLQLSDGRTVHIDVFGAFHVGGVFYQMGGRSGHLPRTALTPASTVVLEGVELAAPRDPEQVLAFLYGPGWRVPDPSFGNVDPAAGLRRIDGWMRGVRTNLVDWNDVFRHRGDLPKVRSSFAVWSNRRMAKGATVVDLGAGSGRDSVWFARRGRAVVALDYSGVALRRTRSRLARLEDEPDVRVILFNDARAVLAAGAELAREPESPYLFARGLIGCLDRDARGNLWRLCSMSLRRGGALFLEFPAAHRGSTRPSIAGLVERVDTTALVTEIEAAGGQVVHLEEGPGDGFLDEPDAYVARLEVRWRQDPSSAAPHPRGEAMSTETETTRGFLRTATALPALIRDLKDAVHENRRLNRRVAELTDIVAELLVPIADRDEERARELLAHYRETTLAP